MGTCTYLGKLCMYRHGTFIYSTSCTVHTVYYFVCVFLTFLYIDFAMYCICIVSLGLELGLVSLEILCVVKLINRVIIHKKQAF